ncbi:MAG: hypothetical protein D6743_19710, partial [Calditrichaeota bacterium]
NGHVGIEPNAHKEKVGVRPEKVWLTCSACGKQVDPDEYFADAVPPNGEFCAECEHREAGLCAECLAYWMEQNLGIKFFCESCAA